MHGSMYPPCDEQRVQARSLRSGYVRSHTVTDRKHPALFDRGASGAFRKRQCSIVNRRVRLAGIEDPPSELFVSARQRTGAMNERFTPVDNDVRVGANHCHSSGRHRPQLRLVIVRRFGLVVSETGAERILGVFESEEPRPPPAVVSATASKRLRSRPGPM